MQAANKWGLFSNHNDVYNMKTHRPAGKFPVDTQTQGLFSNENLTLTLARRSRAWPSTQSVASYRFGSNQLVTAVARECNDFDCRTHVRHGFSLHCSVHYRRNHWAILVFCNSMYTLEH